MGQFTINRVLVETFSWVEVEDKEQWASFIDKNLVSSVSGPDVLVLTGKYGILLFQGKHGFVELKEMIVPEIGSGHQIPLSSTVLIAPVVALSWEIYPFWVTKLIAHEVKIPLTSQTEGY